MSRKSATLPLNPNDEELDAARDSEVLVSILRDVMANNKEILFDYPRDDTLEEIKIEFAAQPSPRKVNVDHVIDGLFEHSPADLWSKLTPEQLQGAMEAAGPLVRRCNSTTSFDNLTKLEPRIRIIQGIPRDNLAYSSVALAHRPGYSTDGRFAVVLLELPWFMHVGLHTFVVENENGKWKVRLRQSIYLL